MKFFLIVFCFLITFSLFAQEELEKNDEIVYLFDLNRTLGGYGGFGFRYINLNHNDGIINGGKGGWYLRKWLVAGGAIYGFHSQVIGETTHNLDGDYQMQGAYGGMYAEIVIGNTKKIHLNIPVLLGVGGINYNKKTVKNETNIDWRNRQIDASTYWIIEPGIELEFNILEYMRFGIGAYFPYTSDITLRYKDNQLIANKNLLQTCSFGANIKFGKF